MPFQVGEGILNLMEQLGDYAIRDSTFFNSISTHPRLTTEFGYGMKYEYIASNAKNASHTPPTLEWEVNAFPRNTPATPPSLDIKWVGSPHHFDGRASHIPTAIVLHSMGGTLASCDIWFNHPTSQVSAHYGIGQDGSIHQYVHLVDGAWANGVLEDGNKWPYTDGANPNYRTISIETEDVPLPVSDQQYASTLLVCRNALLQYPSIRYLVAHKIISPHSKPACPGVRWTSTKMQTLATTLGLELIV